MAKKKVKKKANVKKAKLDTISSIKKRINMVFRRFVFFLIFFVLFLVLDFITTKEMWDNFFGIGTLIFGFICAALLIVILILWFLKIMKK